MDYNIKMKTGRGSGLDLTASAQSSMARSRGHINKLRVL
jgi:hypothetical protein